VEDSVGDWTLLVAALLLAPERICYVWIARHPQAFRRACRTPAVAWIGDPIVVVAVLFGVFKIVQFLVFLWWLYMHAPGGISPPIPVPAILAMAGAKVVVGQLLNLGVFYRLGAIGVFFGDRLGHVVPWRRDFPFSWVAHPQYVGTVLTIWGGFLIARFPNPDWYLLPLVETVFYAVGAHLESGRPRHGRDALAEGRLSRHDPAERAARP
jgi:phosphatidyl-N-methylethanolamine N-methyltransferase